jgi:SAM-dependent methyltransferase
VTALDYSEAALRVACAQHHRSNIEYTLMKVPPLDLPDHSYDTVVCFQMIEHLEKPAELVAEIKRVLRDDGIALFATVNKEEVITDNPYHLHEFTARGFDELLGDYFEAVEMYGVFGDELFMRYWQNNRRWATTFLRLDVLNLSSRLPRKLKQRLFDAAARLMRTRLKHRDPDLCNQITHDNLIFRLNEFAGSLDFFAVCRQI